jgi:hypothetical protein
MIYREYDNSIHGTSDERRTYAGVSVKDTRFYDTDEGIMYTADGTIWRGPGEPVNGMYGTESRIK